MVDPGTTLGPLAVQRTDPGSVQKEPGGGGPTSTGGGASSGGGVTSGWVTSTPLSCAVGASTAESTLAAASAWMPASVGPFGLAWPEQAPTAAAGNAGRTRRKKLETGACFKGEPPLFCSPRAPRQGARG